MVRRVSKHSALGRDIEEIFNFIAERSPQAAVAVLKAIHLCIDEIEEFPEIAPRYSRAALNNDDLRRRCVHNYRHYSIIYQLTKKHLRFLYVHHSRQDLELRLSREGRE